MRKGRLYLILSGIIYGIVPILTRIATAGGSDGATTVLLRSALGLPLLFILLKFRKTSLRLTKRELLAVTAIGAGGSAPAMVLLYAAYERSAVGVASMLHFTYPFVIVLICSLFFKERMPAIKWVGTGLAALGVLLSLDMKTDAIGAVLAAVSGLFYAFFVIYMDKSGIDKMDYFKLTFYVCAIMSAAAFVMCMAGSGVKLPVTWWGWTAAAFVAVMTSLFAVPLFQAGVRYEGSTEAGILSMSEPVTGILVGAMVLDENVTLIGLVGCVLIGIGVILVEKS